VSELEPEKRPKRGLARRRIPQVVVPVPIDQAPDFVRDAVMGTSLNNVVAQVYGGWALFSPRIRLTAVDDEHTLIELDVADRVRGVGTLLHAQRLGEVHRFFIAFEDELARRERSQPQPRDLGRIEGAE
jgi:hypothetical protein